MGGLDKRTLWSHVRCVSWPFLTVSAGGLDLLDKWPRFSTDPGHHRELLDHCPITSPSLQLLPPPQRADGMEVCGWICAGAKQALD